MILTGCPCVLVGFTGTVRCLARGVRDECITMMLTDALLITGTVTIASGASMEPVPVGAGSWSRSVRRLQAAAAAACADDPDGQVASFGTDCATVEGQFGCTTDLSSTGAPGVPVGTLVSAVCPASCDSCPAPPLACADDPDGQVASFGTDCAAVEGQFGCTTDLSSTGAPGVPVGTLVSAVCPAS
eukprot:SAG31_NODE_1569_length_7855_cov_13.073234_1_plen_185_part_10